MRNILYRSAAAGFLISIAACDSGQPAESEQATPEYAECELEIGYSRLRISLPVFVAAEQGFFDDAGLAVCLEQYETAQPLMQALVAGEVDVAGYTALPITFNGMLRNGKKLRFVTAMIEDQDHRISYMLVPAESNITDVSELRGKRIGILPTIAYSKWLEAMLSSNGMSDDDVLIQQVAPNLQPQTLQSGGVDALFTNDPAATTAIQLGVARLMNDDVEVPSLYEDPFVFGSFNVTDKWAKQNPREYDALVVAINRAVDFINENPDEAKQDMVSFLSESFQPHVEFYPDALYYRTDEVTEEMFTEIASAYEAQGIIPSEIDLSDLVEVD